MRKLILAFLFLPFCSSGQIITYSETVSGGGPSNSAPVIAGYFASLPSAVNYGANGGGFLLVNSKYPRLRQSGMVRGFGIRTGTIPPTLRDFRISLWRNFNGTNQRMKVGESENLAGKLVSNKDNTIMLDSPFMAAMGDFIGISYSAPGNTNNWLCATGDQGNMRVTASAPAAVYDWFDNVGNFEVWNVVVPVKTYMDPPLGVFLSNSMNGLPTNFGFLDWQGGLYDPQNSISYLLSGQYKVEIQNMAISGDQVDGMIDRFQSDVVASNPRICFIFSGHNEIVGYYWGGGVAPKYAAEINRKNDSLYDLCRQAGIRPVAFGIPKSAVFTAAQQQTADSVNAHSSAVIASYGGVYVDLSGVTASMLSDGVHFNHTGAAYAAAQAVSAVNAAGILTGGSGASVRTFYKFEDALPVYSSDAAAAADTKCKECLYLISGSTEVRVKN